MRSLTQIPRHWSIVVFVVISLAVLGGVALVTPVDPTIFSPTSSASTLDAEGEPSIEVTQTAAQWPSESGGPDQWTPMTDADGFVIHNEITGQNQPWLRMSSGEPETGERGSLPTVQVASDGDHVFFRQRTLESPYRFAQGQWENQGYHLAAIATEQDGSWQTQARVGMHINRDGQVFIESVDGQRDVIYEGNRDIDQAQGVDVTPATDGNDGGAWTDVQVPISELEQTADIDRDTDVRLFFGTATQPNSINRDFQDNTGTVTFDQVLTTSFDTLTEDFATANPVEITAPEHGTSVSTDQPTIEGTAAAGGSELTIFVNDEPVETISAVNEDWTYQLTEDQALSDGEHTLRAELTRDGQTTTTTTTTFTVDSAEPPTITTDTLNPWTIGESDYEQTITTTDGTAPYTYTITDGALPDGLTLDSETGEISGIPEQAGTFDITVTVTDATGQTDTETYSLTINDQPSITSPSALTGSVENTEYTEQLTANDGTGSIAWEITAGDLPPGLEFDATTGEITGTPMERGTYTFTAEATDDTGATTSSEFTITVTERLAVTTTSLSEWTVEQDGYSESIVVAGGTAPYAFDIASGELPDGLELDAETGELSGTPTATGTFPFTIEVEDADGTTAERSVSIVVNDRPSVNHPDELPDGAVGSAYSQSLFGTGGTEPYSFTISDGELPPGLTIDADSGTISGTPPTDSAGSYTFTVALTDDTGVTETRTYTIDVAEGLDIETDTLDPWTVGQDGYTQSVAADGGIEPYEYQITAGGLPDGLTLNEETGVIIGTPTQVGTFPVTVSVTDRTGTTVSQEYSVLINEPITTTSPAELRTGVETVEYYETLLFEGGTQPVSWEIIAGELPSGLTLDPDTGEITGTPETGSAGTYGFTARVTDVTGDTDTVESSITVGAELDVATTILPDWTAGEPYSETLEAAGGTGPYTWELTDGALPDGLSLDADTGAITGEPTETGTFSFAITVTDADGTEATHSFTIAIADPVTITSPETLPSGVEGVSYSESLTSADGTEPVFWEIEDGELPPGLTLGADGTLDGVISGVPEVADTYTFTASATDAAGSTTEQTFTIEIADGLAIDTTNLDAWTVNQDGYYEQVQASGGTGSYEWTATGLPDGLQLNPESGEITGTPIQRGMFPVTLTVTDEDGTERSETLMLTINDTLEITTDAELPAAVEGVSYDEQLVFDGGTGDVSWERIDGTLPDGLTVTPDGSIEGTPVSDTAGTYTFTLEATDETGATTTREFVLVIDEGLTVTTETTLTPWTADQPGYVDSIDVSGGSEPYTFTLTDGSLPDGLSFDEQAGAITGTPTESGIFTFAITVTDDDGIQDTESFTVTIADSISFTSPATLPDGVEGVSYSEELVFTGGTEPVTWRVEAGELPPCLTLGPDGELDGIISGVPELADEYEFTISATDAAGSTTEQTFTIEITDGLAIDTTEIDAWTINQDGYSEQMRASGGTEPFTWDATGLPDGLELNERTGEITGTPTQSGIFPTRFTVTDADGTQITEDITITINDGPTITAPEQLDGGVEDLRYYEQLTADGGTGPLSWIVAAGELPPGLDLNATTGEITGTPEAGSAGTYSFAIETTDATGTTASHTATITINEDFSITTASLTDTVEGHSDYSQFIGVNGGTGDYTWEVTDGALPPGLDLNSDTGEISGTPDRAGVFAFTVTVTDPDGDTATRQFTITVQGSATIETSSDISGADDVTYSVTIPDVTARDSASFVDQIALDFSGTGISFDDITRDDIRVIKNPDTTHEELRVTLTRTDLSGETPTIGLDRRAQFPQIGQGDTIRIEIDGLVNPEAKDHAVGIELREQATGDRAGLLDVREGTFAIDAAEPPIIQTADMDPWTVDQPGYSQTLEATAGTEPYTWRITSGELPDGLTLDSKTGEISGTPEISGTFDITVEARTADGATAQTSLTLTIHDQPTITTDPVLPSGTADVAYDIQLTAEDGTGVTAWRVTDGSLPDGLSLNPDTGHIAGTPSSDSPGTYTFDIELEDETGATTTKSFTLTITDGLTVSTQTLDAWTANQSGYAAALAASGGTDPYEWAVVDGELPPGVSLDADSGLITGVPQEAGTYTFTVAVTDADDTTVTQDLTIVVNEQPEITSNTQRPDGVSGSPYSQSLTVDGGTGPADWSVIGGTLPPGLSLDADGVISGTPTQAGEYTFIVSVEDATGATQTKEFTLSVGDALATETTALHPWTVGQEGYNQSVSVTGGTEPYRWEAVSGLPDGLTLDPDTGIITGTPKQSGTFTTTIAVTDADGTEIHQEYTFEINDRPTLPMPSDLSAGREDAVYSADLGVTDGTAPYTWMVVDGQLPPGLELNLDTGQITGVPTEAGTYTFTVELTDSTGVTEQQNATITIAEGLTPTTTTVSEWTIGQLGYDEQLAVSGGAGLYSWTVVDGALPNGLELTEDGQITGTPTESGSFTFTVEVTDADGFTATRDITLHINEPAAITSPTELTTGIERVAYSEQLTAMNGTGPIQWTVSDGELPPGLALDATTGVISGTPTNAGTYTFNVTATDATEDSTTQTITIEITDGLELATESLPPWTVDQDGYTASLSVTGGTEPYEWELISGLPDGLEFDTTTGEISGMPTELGSFPVTVAVTDATGTEAVRTYSLVVNKQPTITSPVDLERAADGVSYDQQLTVTGGTGDLSWTVIDGQLPPSLELDPTTGQIIGTPTEPGTYTFTVEVEDEAGTTSQQTFNLVVGDGLTVTTTSLSAWTAQQPGYTATIDAIGGSEPYTWSISDGDLPSGLSLNEDTGLISGTPTPAGTFTFTVTLTDADGNERTEEYTIVVNERVSATTATLAGGVERVANSQQLFSVNGTDPITWAVIDGALPSGMTLTEDGEYTGTPTAAGTYTFTVQATDATGATSSHQITLEITEGLELTTEQLDSWTANQPDYEQELVATGGTEPYTWNITTGTLPAGLTLDTETGIITGTPDEDGIFNVTITVTDADGTEDARNYTLNIDTEEPDPAPDTERCELLGFTFGVYGVCWYWWILFYGITAAVVNYHVQTRLREVTRLSDIPASERRDRFGRILRRLGIFGVVGAAVGLLAVIILWGLDIRMSVRFLVPFLIVLVSAALIASYPLPVLEKEHQK